MKQKMKPVKFNPIMLSRKGAGHINEKEPINLLDYTLSSAQDKEDIVCFVSEKISVSEEIGGTVYDVTGVCVSNFFCLFIRIKYFNCLKQSLFN